MWWYVCLDVEYEIRAHLKFVVTMRQRCRRLVTVAQVHLSPNRRLAAYAPLITSRRCFEGALRMVCVSGLLTVQRSLGNASDALFVEAVPLLSF